MVHLCVLVDTYKTTNLIDLKVTDFTFEINLLPFVFFGIFVPAIAVLLMLSVFTFF